jgi:hypothetical protein
MIYIILFVFLLILLVLCISYFDTRSIIEKFDNIQGLVPASIGNSWTHGFNENETQNANYLQSINKTCNIGKSCASEKGWGYYNADCECIIPSYVETNNSPEIEIAEETYPPKEEYPFEIPYVEEEAYKTDNTCVPNNISPISYCTEKNPKYGVKSIVPCDDTSSDITCARNYIGGQYYGNNTNGEPLLSTPCLDKGYDFNSLCKYYNNHSIPNGYNVNSIGVKYVLQGKNGDCYLPNGLEDKGKARGICSYQFNDQIQKIPPLKISSLNDGTTLLMDYNVYTDCYPTGTNFARKCNQLLRKHGSYASEISSYDCNPGYARARCIKRGDRFQLNKNTFTDSVFNQAHNYNESEHNEIISRCPNNCPDNNNNNDYDYESNYDNSIIEPLEKTTLLGDAFVAPFLKKE